MDELTRYASRLTRMPAPVRERPAASRGGIGFFGMLTILFIGLKLAHVIDWSWWWVLSPLWGIPALLISIALIIAVCMLIGGAIRLLIAIVKSRK